jgi:glycosyltransferase involved in cell wall biosynthesis
VNLKIAHVITRFNRGGTTSWIIELSHGLITRGHEVIIYCGPTKLPEVENSGLSAFNYRQINALGKSINPVILLNSVYSLRKMIRLDRPTVLISHTSHAGIIAKLTVATFAKAQRPVLVHTYHGHFLHGYFNNLGLLIYKLIERATRNLADGYIISGQRVYEELLSARILSIKNPVRLINPPLSSIPKELIPKGKSPGLAIGWLARIAPIKRFDRVVELAKNFPNHVFLVGGDFEMPESQFAELPTNISMRGWVDSHEFWPQCDLALCTSDNEAQPISLLEAASFGIPALTTNVGGCANAVLHMKTGIVVEPSVDDLTIGLQTYVENPELITKFGQNARIRALLEYTNDSSASNHEEYFVSLLKSFRK